MRAQTAIALVLVSLVLPGRAIAQQAEDGQRQKKVEVTPYIEAAQVLLAELSPGDDVVTYTRVAAGVDAQVAGRNNAAALSLRYERRIGWSDDSPDGDVISGIARVSASIVPRALTIEAGGLAARTRVEGNGGALLSPIYDNAGKSNIYSAFAGPSLRTNIDDVAIEGHYRIGYTSIEQPDAIVTAPGADPVDLFDDSVVHSANVHIGTRPNTVLPVGVGVGAGWFREDISNLDQRVDDKYVRGDIMVPVSPNVALVGGVGYEDVEVSSRDALRDTNGDPVIGDDGRLVTDPDSPRQIAYQTDGLIWDAGVVWRPSRRTSLEAHVGHRYGSMSYYGTLAYAPNSRSSFNVGVYDMISGFGGQVNQVLANLPTDFTANRNPLTGDLGNCVATLEGNGCLGGTLAAVRSATFRSRGVAASYMRRVGQTQLGIAAGYDNRKFIAADGTVLAAANGVSDETIWVAGFMGGRIDAHSRYSASVYANWFESGFDPDGSTAAFGASAAYYRDITKNLTATAAVSVDGVTREHIDLEDYWSAAALLGLRYSF